METSAHLAAVREGDVLAGKYCVEEVLGSGGMGVVVSAHHIQLGQRVAVKFLLPHACANAQAMTRFVREARAAVQLQSEHAARVIDVGTLETGAPYIVMELLRGCDLAQILETEGPLPIAQAVGYVLQACEAIAEAHALGIVHRDLKPRNLFLTHRPDGSPLVKVLDFGISKSQEDLLEPSAAALTRTGAVLGSPLYMSPEQIRNARTVDRRTDIWSLGIILYELLAGQPVFMAETLSGLLAAIVADDPHIRRTLSGVPPGIVRAIQRCLEKDVNRRYPNVAVLAMDLAPYASAEDQVCATRTARIARSCGGRHEGAATCSPAATRPLGRALLTPGALAAWTASRMTFSRRWRRTAAFAALGGLLALGAVVIALAFFVRNRGQERANGLAPRLVASSTLAAVRTARDSTGGAGETSTISAGVASITVVPTEPADSAHPDELSAPLDGGARAALAGPASNGGRISAGGKAQETAIGATLPRPHTALQPEPHKLRPPRTGTSTTRHRDRGSELFNDIE